MGKRFKSVLLCFCLVFCVHSNYIAKASEPLQNSANAITLEQTNDIAEAPAPPAQAASPQNPDATLIQITPESTAPLIDAEKERKTKELQLKAEENIFGRTEFKKTFDSGIVKDVKLVGAHDFMFQGWKQSNGISHNWIDDRMSLWGVQGHLRDGTIYNFTFLPLMEGVANYPHFSNNLFEYYLKRDITKHQSITVGQQRTPNTIDGSRSSFGLPIGRRSQMGNTYSNIVAIGAKASGNWDRVEYNAGVFDTGRFLSNTFNSPPEFAGLVSFKPIKNNAKYGTLKIGGGYNGGRRDYSYSVYSGHVMYDYKKAHVDFEYASANGYNGRTNVGTKSNAYYTTFIYKLSPKWEPFLRVDTLNANSDLPGKKNTEYTIGTHYYLKGRKTRLTLSYIYANNESAADSSKLFTMFEVLL